jgi:hypothetical protein
MLPDGEARRGLCFFTLRQPEWSFSNPRRYPFLLYLREVKRARRGGLA